MVVVVPILGIERSVTPRLLMINKRALVNAGAQPIWAIDHWYSDDEILLVVCAASLCDDNRVIHVPNADQVSSRLVILQDRRVWLIGIETARDLVQVQPLDKIINSVAIVVRDDSVLVLQ